MYAIEASAEFCASHQLRLPDGSLEPLHGHNWRVCVRVKAVQLDALETVMDFHVLERLLRQIVQPWINSHLNTLPPFDQHWNPSAERVAEAIATQLAPLLPSSTRLLDVSVTEAPGCRAFFLAD